MKYCSAVSRYLFVLTAVLAVTLASRPAEAQAAQQRVFEEVRFEQRLDEQVPLDLEFRDETGRGVRLGDYFGQGKPVVLALVYYECPMLCTLVLNGLVRSLRAIDFRVADQFDVVVVSFDARETPELAAAKKQVYLKQYGHPASAGGWHFLTGSEGAIGSLTRAVGFHHVYDPEDDQFAHASGIVVMTPQGKVARYLFGIDYPARDLRFSLMEASENRIGSRVDQLMLLCYHYDPKTGRYGLIILNSLRIAGAATVLGLGIMLFVLFRRERKGPGTK